MPHSCQWASRSILRFSSFCRRRATLRLCQTIQPAISSNPRKTGSKTGKLFLHEVRTTYLRELGHFFGWNEEQIENLGVTWSVFRYVSPLKGRLFWLG
jgi:hypothetical protein